MLQLWSKLPIKIKRSEYFAVCIHAKIVFLITIHRKELSRKEIWYRFVIAHVPLFLDLLNSKLMYIVTIYSPYKVVWWIPKLILIAYKKVFIVRCLEWSILLTGVVYFMTDNLQLLPFSSILNYFVILICKWSYSFYLPISYIPYKKSSIFLLTQLESLSHLDKKAEEYSEPCQVWKIVLFAKTVNGFQSLTILAKSATILDV